MKKFILVLVSLIGLITFATAEDWDFSSYTKDYGIEVHGNFGEVSGVIPWSNEASANEDFDSLSTVLKHAKNGRFAIDFDTIYEGAVFAQLLNMYGYPKKRLLNITYTYKFGDNAPRYMNVLCIWTAPDKARVAIFYNY